MTDWTESSTGTWPPGGVPDGSPDHLLARVQNPFELPAALVGRLRTALARHTALHSCHHSSEGAHPARRSTYRHTYLLPDGGNTSLWELVHTIGADSVPQHEVYADKDAAEQATARLRTPDGAPAFPFDGPETDMDLEELAFSALPLLFGSPMEPPRSYVPDNSADHARRVLRRAENPDRPGEETRELLRTALAHEITQVTRRHCRLRDRVAGFSLYEHAFLLLDGGEFSLWEVEHSLGTGGRPVCEVYLSEEAALDSMERRL